MTPGANPPDLSGVDWATVDLTTIDWATIDLSQVDWRTIEDNPTAKNLDAATTQLIGSRLNHGNATLTIGDQTWEFDNFACAFGHVNTESSVYSFTTNSRGEHEGARTQMQATIRDPSGGGAYQGAGLTHEIQLDDVSDFENPGITWSMSGPDGITIDGDDIRAEGTFDDGLTDGKEAVPGTLVARCADQSRR